MKIKLSIFFIGLSMFAFGQVALGKSEVSNPSVSLEFGTQYRGFILPYVTSLSSVSDVVPGTVVMDGSDGIVKYARPNGDWRALTFNTTHTFEGVTLDTTGKVDRSLQSSKTDKTDASVIIGANTSGQPSGILVLSDNNKAMILPKMDSPHLKIINPAPGMMAYDTKMNQLAVFNGTVWTFWKD
ncbi:hypothetical protein PG279_03520 [Riemerella anatipestifer]|nr:hypothetical protein [Riemerella anatipestifer]